MISKGALISPKFIALVYILATVAISNVISVDSFWISLFAAPAFFIIPTLIGDGFVTTVFNWRIENDALYYFAMWLTGSLILLVYGLLLTVVNVFSSQLFSVSALLMSISSIYCSLRGKGHRDSIGFNMFRRYFRFLLAIFLALLPLFVFKFLTGFPGNYSIVGYRFMYISEAAAQRNVIVLDQLTSYAPVFQVPMSIVSTLYNVDSYGLDWFVVFVINILFFVGIYTFLRSTLLDEIYCLLGAVISSYILVWNPSYLFPVIHDVQPRTLALVLFPFLLSSIVYALRKEHNTKKQSSNMILTFAVTISIFMIMRQAIHPELVNRVLIIIPTLISLVYSTLLGALNRDYSPATWFSFSLILCAFPLVHVFEGVYYAVLSSFFALAFIVVSKHFRIAKAFAYGFSSLLFVTFFFIANNIMQLDQNLRLALPSWLAPSVQYEYVYLPKVYCEILFNALSQASLYLLIIGIAVGIFSARGKNSRLLTSSLITLCLTLTLYLLPIPDIVRVGAALSPFIIYFIVSGVEDVVSKISKRDRRLQVIATAFVLVVIIPSLFSPFVTYVNTKASLLQGAASSSQLSLVTDYEYRMGLWIRANTPKNAVIVSDPETMYIMAGISGRPLPISLGMVMEDLQISDLVRINWIKFGLLVTENASEAAFYANLLGEDTLIVISGRTEKWLSSVQFVSEPHDFGSATRFLSKFLDTEGHFRLLHSIDEKIYIFGPKDVFFQEHSYDVFFVNNFSQYGNVTKFSSDWRNSTHYWYLERTIVSGEVTTIVYEQYSSSGGDPSTIEWQIPLSKNYSMIDVFVYDLGPLNVDQGAFFSFSSDGRKLDRRQFFISLEICSFSHTA